MSKKKLGGKMNVKMVKLELINMTFSIKYKLIRD
jgi:hypothetical protein